MELNEITISNSKERYKNRFTWGEYMARSGCILNYTKRNQEKKSLVLFEIMDQLPYLGEVEETLVSCGLM